MKLILHHVPNPDIRGGYRQTPIDPAKTAVDCATLRECSAALVAWVDFNGLGSGNMAANCGTVSDGGKIIAEIGYNGRAWEPGAWAPGGSKKEIALQ